MSFFSLHLYVIQEITILGDVSDFTGEGIIFVLSNLPSNSIAYLIKTHTRGVPFLCGFFLYPRISKALSKNTKKEDIFYWVFFLHFSIIFQQKIGIESNTGSSVIFHSVLVNSTGRQMNIRESKDLRSKRLGYLKVIQ